MTGRPSVAIQFGRYQLLRKLASGGMAEIFLARAVGEAGFEKTCVVKRILPHLAAQPKFVEMFLDEARLAARLSHPNIVQLFDLGKEGDSYFIAMEHLEGADLRTLLAAAAQLGQSLPFEVVARIGASTAAALAYAHRLTDEQGRPLRIIHRDVSPSNIFLTSQGVVKVLDFGIASAERASSAASRQTLHGKRAYLAPEQLEGAPGSTASDVYALGVCLYELVTGKPLFGSSSSRSAHPAPPVRTNRSETPAPLAALIDQMLRQDPGERPKSAAQVRETLEAFLADRTYVPNDVELSGFLSALIAKPPAQDYDLQVQGGDTRAFTGPVGRAAPVLRSSQKRWIALGGLLVLGAAITAFVAAGWKERHGVAEKPVPAIHPNADVSGGAESSEPVSTVSSSRIAAPAPLRRPDRRARESKAGKGKLDVFATPWADVLVNGKRIGQTPIEGFALGEGSHRVRLLFPGGERTVEVDVAAGRTSVIRQTFP